MDLRIWHKEQIKENWHPLRLAQHNLFPKGRINQRWGQYSILRIYASRWCDLHCIQLLDPPTLFTLPWLSHAIPLLTHGAAGRLTVPAASGGGGVAVYKASVLWKRLLIQDLLLRSFLCALGVSPHSSNHDNQEPRYFCLFKFLHQLPNSFVSAFKRKRTAFQEDISEVSFFLNVYILKNENIARVSLFRSLSRHEWKLEWKCVQLSVQEKQYLSRTIFKKKRENWNKRWPHAALLYSTDLFFFEFGHFHF